MAYKCRGVCLKDRSGLRSSRELEGRSSNESYREFDDLPSGGWTYQGDGHEQVEWFENNTNVNDLIWEMNYGDIAAFEAWGSGWFMWGQQYRGWDNMNSEDRTMTRVFDKYLDRATMYQGVTLRRLGSAELLLGAGNREALSLGQLQALEGRDVFSKGSMSFGAAKQGLTIGDDSKNVEYKLRIPKGAVGSGMWIGDRRINGHGPNQREFMTNRDVYYTVGKTTYDSSRGVYVVELTYKGRGKHDYGRNGR